MRFLLLSLLFTAGARAAVQCQSPSFGKLTITDTGTTCSVSAHTIDQEDYLQIAGDGPECTSYTEPSGRTIYSARLFSAAEPEATFTTVVKLKDRRIQEYVMTLEWLYTWSFTDFTDCIEI